MDALKLAFDTIIVGVLALPWLAIVIDLFLASKPAQERQFWSLLQSGETKVPTAVVGVLLFAVAYLLGSALARVSRDLFNDDDLHLPFTEDRIRMAVYCGPAERMFLPDSFSALGPQMGPRFSVAACSRADSTPVLALFNLQESSLQQRGSDKTTVLEQLRSQISILRGAALNGFVTAVLCLFGFGANRTRWRLLLWGVAVALVGSGLYALLFRHWMHALNDPPIMEFTLIVLGITGGFALWNGAPPRQYGLWFLLSTLLTGMAVLAWWWTEILYDQLVLHSSFALVRHLVTP
jgi:hypothetical protein